MTEAKPFPFAFFEGEIVPLELARVNIMTNALQYGNAIFGGIRGYVSPDRKKLNIFRLEDHYKRFLDSLKIINKSIPYDESQLKEITLELARKNGPKSDTYFRPFAYAADLLLLPDLSKVNFRFALYMQPLEHLMSNAGLKVTISSWMRTNDNMIPSRAKLSGGYINSSLAKAEAVRLGYDDALLLGSDGHIAEGTGANFFMVRGGKLITSPEYADVLEGITRRTIMELARDLDISLETREIDRTECYIADEAFLSGTGYQLVWIKEVDGRVIGEGRMGPLTEKIQKLFFNIVREKEKKYLSWLTKV